MVRVVYNYPSKKSKLDLKVYAFFLMRAHKLISKCLLAIFMRPINVTLDATTWELAKQKSNFSAWVRSQLRSERNQREQSTRYCTYCMRHHPRENFYDHQCITIGEEE